MEVSTIYRLIDPKKFNRRKNSDNPTEIYTLNEKSDVYSVGVLLWEISSGQPPFYIEGEQYDIDLAIEISQGLREKSIPDTPEDYVKVYTGNIYNYYLSLYITLLLYKVHTLTPTTSR